VLVLPGKRPQFCGDLHAALYLVSRLRSEYPITEDGRQQELLIEALDALEDIDELQAERRAQAQEGAEHGR
jgi:hypothetical protein